MKCRHLYARSVITIGLPFFLIWAFFETFIAGVLGTAYRSYLETLLNIEQYKRFMKQTDY